MKNSVLFLDGTGLSTPAIIGISAGGAILIVIIIVILVLILKKKKTKAKHIKVDDEFTNNLVALLGGKENIQKVDVDNGRLKFTVENLDKADLEGIKKIATSGVFVTGNIIKTLFKLDSLIIKKAVEKII